VTLNFGLRPKSQTKLMAETKVWSETTVNLSIPVSNQTIVIRLARQLSLAAVDQKHKNYRTASDWSVSKIAENF